MGFLSPWFLGGLVAVGLPVYLHLLKRHTNDPKPFPSLMFFEQREMSSVMHRRLDYLVLFALRALMLILLALLFASPFIRLLTPKGAGNKIYVIAVDNSASMKATLGAGSTRLDKAKQDALAQVASFPADKLKQVIALSGTVQAMTQQVADPGEIRAAIASIPPTDGRGSFGELSRFLRTLNESTKTPLEVHFFSDLQKSAMPPGFADLRLDPDTTIEFHAIGSEAPNYAVENVVAPRRVFDPKRVRIQATITAYGAPAAKKTASLILNGKTVQSKEVDIPAGGRGQVEFLGLDASYGFNKCEVKIDSADALASDDHFPFSVERADPKKVLFVDEGKRPLSQLYFRAALDSSPDAAFTLEVQRPESAAALNLTSYGIVVLNDVGTMPASFAEALTRYVTNGGAALVALGPSSAYLPRVPIADEAISQEATRYASRDAARFLAVSEIDNGHPVLKSVERFDGVKFYQVVHTEPKNSRVLARLGDQTPLVFERQIGEGKVMVFASTFDNISNDLPLHASWVPFVQKSAEYLGGGGPEQPVNLAAGTYVELRSSNSQSAAAEVIDPEGRRALTLEEATKAPNYPLDREGFYEVKTANGRHNLLAVHTDRRESDFAPIPKETLDLWGATGGSPTAGPGATNAQTDDLRKPWSLAPYLLILLILVALAESIVADRYLRPAAPVEGQMKKEAA